MVCTSYVFLKHCLSYSSVFSTRQIRTGFLGNIFLKVLLGVIHKLRNNGGGGGDQERDEHVGN